MSEQWGPWVDHDGMGCPCVGMYVQAKLNRHGRCPYGRMSNELEGIARGSPEGWDKTYKPYMFAKIIRYRIRKPKALQRLIELAASPDSKKVLETP